MLVWTMLKLTLAPIAEDSSGGNITVWIFRLCCIQFHVQLIQPQLNAAPGAMAIFARGGLLGFYARHNLAREN